MEKWDEIFGTFNPKPINRTKYFFLWLSVVVEKAVTFG